MQKFNTNKKLKRVQFTQLAWRKTTTGIRFSANQIILKVFNIYADLLNNEDIEAANIYNTNAQQFH